MSVNKAIIVGRLGTDPELRYMPDGTAVANLSVATSETWKDKNSGERREATEWHRISLFGKVAEIAGQYLRKGSEAYFEGRIQTRKWQDKDNQDRYTTEIRCDVLRLLGGRKDSEQAPHGAEDNGYRQPAQSNTQPARQAQPHHAETGKNTGFSDFDDDIPF